MPSGQETDWAYSITTVPGTHTGLKPVGSQFHARGVVTEKASSPIFQLVLGTTRSQLLDERSDDRE